MGIVVGAGAGDDDAAKSGGGPASNAAAQPPLPLATAVGQVLMIAFDGTEPPAWVRRWLGRDQAAGVILFGGNAPDAATTKRVTGALQAAGRGGALVATDQEGGEIRSLAFAPPEAAQPDLDTAAAVRAASRGAIDGLKRTGVNVNLAPVADVTESGSALAGRGYPGDPGEVARSVQAALGVYRGSGVAATVKHYPGLGRAAENTDDAAVSIPTPRAELTGADLRPFAVAVRAGAPLVMASHASYPSFDRERIASQSPVLLEEVLRKQLGFRGVVVTDSIEAEAVGARSGVGAAAERSLAAGSDLILMTGSGAGARSIRACLPAPGAIRHSRRGCSARPVAWGRSSAGWGCGSRGEAGRSRRCARGRSRRAPRTAAG